LLEYLGDVTMLTLGLSVGGAVPELLTGPAVVWSPTPLVMGGDEEGKLEGVGVVEWGVVMGLVA
jgi:hypothetical protein